MKFFLLAFLAIILMASKANAQQIALVSNYLQNGILINPAYSGSVGALSVSLSSRLQWQGVADAPYTNVLAAHTPLPIRFISTGLVVGYNKFGFSNTTDIYNTYSARFKVKKYTVSIGAMIGFSSINNSIDNSKLITESDLAFSQSNLQSLLPRAGFGIHVSQKKFYLGFSVPSFAIGNNNNVTDFFYNQQFFYGGYNWKVSDNFTLKPSIYARSLKGFGFLPDVNLMATFFSRFTGGVSYRHSYALIGLLNVKVNNQLHFGYSYDYLLPGNNAIASVSNGSHEIFIRYDFLYLVDNINMKKFK